jgi:hypothetical protein
MDMDCITSRTLQGFDHFLGWSKLRLYPAWGMGDDASSVENGSFEEASVP